VSAITNPIHITKGYQTLVWRRSRRQKGSIDSPLFYRDPWRLATSAVHYLYRAHGRRGVRREQEPT
jgi:hypothetical protein